MAVFPIDVSCVNNSDFDNATFIRWKNVSNFSEEELETYFCAYKDYLKFQSITTAVVWFMNLAFGVLGLISSCLVLTVLFRNNEFSSLCFFYFRAISFFEIFDSVATCAYALRWLYPDAFRFSYGWIFLMELIVYPIGSMASTLAEILIIYLSFERAVACLLPTKFYLLKKWKVAVTVVSISALVSFLVAVPSIFGRTVRIHPTNGCYQGEWTENPIMEWYATAIGMFMYALAVIVVISSALAIAGVIRALKSQRSVQPQTDPETGSRRTSNATGAGAIRHVQLCYLQLSQAIPMTFNYIFYAAATVQQTMAGSSFLVGVDAVKGAGNLNHALGVLSFGVSYRYIWVLGYLFNDIAHFTHFYLYLAFSEGFRIGVKKRLGLKSVQ